MNKQPKGYTYEGMPKTMVRDHKRYLYHNSYLKREQAEWDANKLRQKGWRTRMFKILGLYAIYKRRSEKVSKKK